MTATNEGIEVLVLFGSVARGEEHDDSDIDLIVDGPVTDDFAAWSRLRGQLLEQLDRPIGLLTISEAESAPEVLVGALKEGRVIKDQAGRWRTLMEELPRFEAEARALHATYPRRRAMALARLAEGAVR
jgi:predicted nucleotidyltransferase